MKKVIIIFLFGSPFVIAGISSGSNAVEKRIHDEKILTDSGIYSWVPNPLVGSHTWKKFFSDENSASWLCLFALLPSVIINSEINSPLQRRRCYNQPTCLTRFL